MTTSPWPEEEIRSFASIGTGAKDTKDRVDSGRYPFFVRSQKVERIDSWSFDGEAILTAGDGVGTGKVFHYIDGKFDYHQRVYRISDFPAEVSGRYFFYQFSRNFLARIESLTAKSSVDSVRMETIAGMKIPLPDRAEQDRIVHAIKDAERMVVALEQLIVKKEAIRQGLMQQLLAGRTRLPGFSEPWSEVAVGAVAVVTMGQSPPGSSYNTDGDGTPLVQGNADIRDRATVDRIWTTEPTKLCGVGDVVLTVRAPVGYTAVASNQCCLGRGVSALSAGVSNRFLFHALVYAEPKWMLYEQGSTFTAVNSNEVRSFKLFWPADRAERLAIGEVLDDADGELRALRQRLTKARSIKDGMTQQLLTGRTRLPVKEVAA